MKFFILLFTTLLIAGSSVYAQFGSFIVLKNTYLFSESGKGKKVLTRAKRAYSVVDMQETKKQGVKYLVIVPWKKQVVTGSGFIIQNEEDLKDADHPMVRVFEQVPDATSDLTQYKTVPAKHLQLTGRKEVSKDFPNLTWRAVNYKTTMPKKLWVKEWAGLYRQDKTAEWMNKIYLKSLKIKMSSKVRQKVLLGLIETGFSSQLVRLALGEPEEQTTDEAGLLEWQYHDKRVIFKENKVHQVL